MQFVFGYASLGHVITCRPDYIRLYGLGLFRIGYVRFGHVMSC